MSFRWRLLGCLTLAVLAGAAVEAVTDYLVLQRNFERELGEAFERVGVFAETAIRFEGGRPSLVGSSGDVPLHSRFRLLGEENIVLERDRTRVGAELTFRQSRLPGGYTLELGVDSHVYRAPLVDSLRQDLIDNGLQIALSLALAALLARFILSPIRILTKAVNEVSLQHFPEPVPVPPGDDAFALLARSFNRMSANTKAAIDRERIFTRYASHELRTPLTAMKLQLEALELGASSADEATPALQRNLDRMQRVLEALLSLARASEQDHEPISLTHLVSEAVKLLPEERRHRVVFSNKLSPQVKVPEPYLVGQCVLNLVDNALKYTSDEVTVTLVQQGASAQVQVKDRGAGVPEAYVEKLTDTFFRLASHVDGSGLGLAFVKHIMRTLGGELSFINATSGFEAVLTLPTVQEEP